MELNIEVNIFFEIDCKNYKYDGSCFFIEGTFGFEEVGLTEEQCKEFFKEYNKIEKNKISDYV